MPVLKLIIKYILYIINKNPQINADKLAQCIVIWIVYSVLRRFDKTVMAWRSDHIEQALLDSPVQTSLLQKTTDRFLTSVTCEGQLTSI